MRTGLVKLRGDIFTNYTWCPSRLKLTFHITKRHLILLECTLLGTAPQKAHNVVSCSGGCQGCALSEHDADACIAETYPTHLFFLGAEMSIHHSHTARMYTNMHTPMYTNYHNTYIHTQHIYKHKTHIQTHITYTHTQHTHTTHMHTLKHIYTYTTHTHTQLQHIYTSTLSFLLGDNIAPQD